MATIEIVNTPPTPPTGATRPIDLNALKALLPDRAILIQMSGADAGQVRRLDAGEYLIGRGQHCHFCFADGTLSREHARIVCSGGAYYVEDLHSTNGTFVNHERVDRRVLRHGDFIRLGSGVRLQFQQVTGEEEATLVHLYEASVRDGLTGVFNRRYLEERIEAEVAYAVRHGTDLSLLMLDIDHFKHINDTHGHLAGDEVLRRLAGLVAGQIRREDVLARYGGEEFVLLLRNISVASATMVAERIRASVEALETSFEGTTIRATLSIGVASLGSCQRPVTPKALLDAADQALYQAKEAGRNRVVVSHGSPSAGT